MKMLALSGWGQPYDALASVLPEATHFAYAHHDTVDAALADLGHTGKGYETVVGWSLGGQLAARAIAEGLIAPKKLVLIAAPFQFVEIDSNGLGMGRETFAQFFHNFVHHPLRTLHKAWNLIHYDDRQAMLVQSMLGQFSMDAVLANDWLKWLSMIDGLSAEDLDFSRFPSTLLVHGANDVVVSPAQSEAYARCIPAARLEVWEGCGHAPHWHDTEKLRALIKEHIRV